MVKESDTGDGKMTMSTAAQQLKETTLSKLKYLVEDGHFQYEDQLEYKNIQADAYWESMLTQRTTTYFNYNKG
jgi:hypothetical protein